MIAGGLDARIVKADLGGFGRFGGHGVSQQMVFASNSLISFHLCSSVLGCFGDMETQMDCLEHLLQSHGNPLCSRRFLD